MTYIEHQRYRSIALALIIFTLSLGTLHAQIDLDFSSGVADGKHQFPHHVDADGSRSFTAGDSFYFDNVGTDFATGMTIDAQVKILETNTQIENVWGNNHDSMAILLGKWGDNVGNPYVTYNLSFWQSDGVLNSVNTSVGNEYTINNLTMQVSDIDSYRGGDFSDIFGYQTATNSPDSVTLAADTKLEQKGFDSFQEIPVETTKFTTFALQPDSNQADGKLYDDHANITTNAANDILEDYTVNLTYDQFHEGDFIWGFTGKTSPSTYRRGVGMNGSETLPVQVTPSAPTPSVYALSMIVLLYSMRSFLRKPEASV